MTSCEHHRGRRAGRARQLIAKYKPAAAAGAQYSEPRLEIFNKGVLKTGVYPSRLAWFVEATDLALRQYIWVDAQTGAILMQFSQLTDAKSRKVYTADGGTTLPGTLLRSEGGPATGDPDADNAYTLRRRHLRLFLRQSRPRQLRQRRRPADLHRALPAASATPARCRTPSGTAPRWSTATATRRPTTSSGTS